MCRSEEGRGGEGEEWREGGGGGGRGEGGLGCTVCCIHMYAVAQSCIIQVRHTACDSTQQPPCMTLGALPLTTSLVSLSVALLSA